jgi:hypothetical protein
MNIAWGGDAVCNIGAYPAVAEVGPCLRGNVYGAECGLLGLSCPA